MRLNVPGRPGDAAIRSADSEQRRMRRCPERSAGRRRGRLEPPVGRRRDQRPRHHLARRVGLRRRARPLSAGPDRHRHADRPAEGIGNGGSATRLARKAAVGVASSVFPAPSREVVESWREGDRYGPGLGISAQAWNLIPAIQQVDRLMTADLQKRVIEVHPEGSFREMGHPDRCLEEDRTGRRPADRRAERTTSTSIGWARPEGTAHRRSTRCGGGSLDSTTLARRPGNTGARCLASAPR